MTEQLGRYILDRKIAEGGMAEVFLARQSGPQGYERVCVVKRMLPHISDDHVMVQMFLDEARLAAQLTHPNIAQIYDFGEVRGAFFLAMEFIPGCSLRDLIDEHAERKSYMPSPIVARIVAEAATALDYAHSAVGANGTPLKVIHRDVSPQNVLLSASGAVKLIDFGIAKANTARQETVAGTIKGKFAYMSPEQIRGEPLDGRSDIYALGLVLYELLTNTRALEGSSEHALMEAVYFARIVPPTMLRADIPLRLLEVLSRTISKETDARYPTAGEMAQALEQYVSETGSPVSPRQLAQLVTAPRQAARAPPKSPSPAGQNKSGRKPSREAPVPATAIRRTESSGEATIVERPTDRQPAIPPGLSPRPDRRPSAEAVQRPTIREDKPLVAATRVPVEVAPDTAPDGRPLAKEVLPDTAPDGRPAPTDGWIDWVLGLGWRGRVALLVFAVLLSAGTVWIARRISNAVSGKSTHYSVAVLDFQNLAGRPDSAWLATALSEMIGTELSSPDGLRVIPGEHVARAQADLGLAGTLDPSADSLARLRRNLGCDRVVSGAYLALGGKGGGQLRVDVKIRSAPEGETIAAFHETGSEGDLPSIVARLGQSVRVQLGAPDERRGVTRAYRSTPEGTRLYADGVAALRRYDILGAQASLEKAVAANPDNPLAYAALANVWQQLGSDARAAEMAHAALERSSTLSREQKLEIQARNDEMSHAWTDAQNVYRTLWTFFPDAADYGLGLARAQYLGGDGTAALVTIDQLRRTMGAEDPRVDLEEARAAVTISDYKRADLAAVRAASKAKAIGSTFLQAQALLQEGWAASYLGDNARAIASLDAARALCEPLGDRSCVARAMDWAGTVYNDQGDFERASARLEASVALAKSCGDGVTEMGALNNLGLVEFAQGHLAHARELLDQALEIAARLGMRRARAGLTDTQARVLAALAVPDAERMELGVAGEFLALGDRGGASVAKLLLGEMALDRGDPAKASEILNAALGTLRELKMQIGVAEALQALAAVREERDEAADARRLMDDEVKVATELGASAFLANARVAQARLLLGAGRAADAAATAEQAISVLHERHALDDEVAARVTLSHALRRAGRLPDAQQALAGAEAFATASENPRTRLGFRIEAAALAAHAGQPADALADLAPALSEAHELGLVRVELEGRLVEGDIELLAGHRRKGIARLQAVARDAASRGFVRVARLATALTRE